MYNQVLNQQPQAIDLRAQQAVRMVLEGLKIKEIAEILQVSHGTINNWFRRPEVSEMFAERKSAILDQLDEELADGLLSKVQTIDKLGWKALKRMEQILDDPTAHKHIVAKVAIDVLDRDPVVSKTKRLDITTRNFTMTGEDLLHAVKSMQEVEARTKDKAAEEPERENPK